MRKSSTSVALLPEIKIKTHLGSDLKKVKTLVGSNSNSGRSNANADLKSQINFADFDLNQLSPVKKGSAIKLKPVISSRKSEVKNASQVK